MKPLPKITEYLVVSSVADWFSGDGYCVWREVPNMGQSADLVAAKDENITFLEAKLADWRRALKQCRAHEAVADFIYVAIASCRVAPGLIAAAKERGYGLLHFSIHDRSITVVHEPVRNINVWPPQRRELSRLVEQLTHEN